MIEDLILDFNNNTAISNSANHNEKIEIFPNEKKIVTTLDLVRDYYIRVEEYHYIFDEQSLRLNVRLISRVDTDSSGREVKVSNGKIAETFISKKYPSTDEEEFFESLNAQTTWHEIDMSNNYILYLTTTTLLNNQVGGGKNREFLDFCNKRILNGTLLVEYYVSSKLQKQGLVVENSSSGSRGIWFNKNHKDYKNYDVYDSVQSMYNFIFDPNSENYVGISLNEFKKSYFILNFLTLIEGNLDKNIGKNNQEGISLSGSNFAVKLAFILSILMLVMIVINALS